MNQPKLLNSARFEQIWHTIAQIPKGKVASYGQVADLAGLPGRARLVGTALKKTPKEVCLPWHRVLRSDGRLAFSQGSNSALVQTQRLQDEGVEIVGQKVKMKNYRWQPSLAEILCDLQY